MDDGIKARTERIIKHARVTLVEKAIYDAIVSYEAANNLPLAADRKTSQDKSKDQINAQVRGFSHADIKSSDLHLCIWSTAQRVIKNESLV